MTPETEPKSPRPAANRPSASRPSASRFAALMRPAESPEEDSPEEDSPPAQDLRQTEGLDRVSTAAEENPQDPARPARDGGASKKPRGGRRSDPAYRPATVYLPADLHDAALDAARAAKRAGDDPDTVSGVVEAALRAYLAGAS